MSKYYQALSKIQTQYNEKLQKEEAKKKEDSIFVNSVENKIKAYSNLEKTRDVLVTLRPLFIILAVLMLALVFYVAVKQGMLIKASQVETPEAEAARVEMAPALPAVTPEDVLPLPVEASVQTMDTVAPVPVPPPSGRFTLQLVTYSDAKIAAEEVARLKKKDYDAFVVSRGRFHQICINRFEKAGDAREFQREMKTKGFLDRYPGSYVREVPTA